MKTNKLPLPETLWCRECGPSALNAVTLKWNIWGTKVPSSGMVHGWHGPNTLGYHILKETEK